MNVALIAPPWPLFNRPSIQTGALKAYLDAVVPGMRAFCFHPYLNVAVDIGFDAYNMISQSSWASESVFSALLFREDLGQERLFRQGLRRRFGRQASSLDFQDICRRCEAVVELYLKENDLSRFRVAGISVCLNQLFAGLYIARKIKEKWPHIVVVFGGASVSGAMGISLKDCFSFIDFIIQGEGEIPFAMFCEKIMKEDQGIMPDSAHIQVPDMDSLPPPDYQHYFAEMARLGLKGVKVVLPVEASRGCWWNRCAFCNLNLQWRGYRQKSPHRVAQDISCLSSRYGVLDFAFMDNVLPRRNAADIFKQIGKDGKDYRFFAELRAVHSRRELASMKRAGLKDVQVGIEALCTSLLKRLGKGSTAMDNLAVMRHCKELGINLQSNLITCFPGSTKDEVQQTLEALDYTWPFFILKPVTFWLGMGSPVFHSPKDFGIARIRPHRYYRYLFPKEVLDVLRPLVHDYTGDRGLQDRIWRPVHEKISEMERRRSSLSHKEPFLTYRDGGDFLLIRQVLESGETLLHRLSGKSRLVYLKCMEPKGIEEISSLVPEISRNNLLIFLDDLFRKRLMFREDDRFLSLAIKEPFLQE